MLSAARIGGKHKDGGVRCHDESHANHRLLNLGPALVRPVKKKRSRKRRRQCHYLHRCSVSIEAEPVRDDDA